MTARQILSSVVIAAIIMFALPVFFDVLNLTTFAAYALLALSLGFVWGYGGILCFGQTAFYGLGAYVYALTAINTGEAWSGFFLAILLPALFAAILGAMMFYGRLSDVYLAVVTLVVSLILFRFMNHTAGEQWIIGEARLGGFNGIPGFPTLHMPGDPEAYIYDENLYYFTFVVLVLCYLLTRWLLGSPFGRILVGLRENEQRIELLGYDVRARKTAAFAFGGALAGLAGCLYANAAEIITPELFGLGLAAEIIIWVIVGGAGTLIGPMIGAALLGYLKFVLGLRAVKEVFGKENPLEATLVFGVILILFILFLPRGMVPSIRDWLRPSASARGRAAAVVGGGGRGDGVVEARGVSVRFGGVAALDSVDFTLADRELRCLIGPNGAGKSTFFKCLTGVLRPSEGDIRIRGIDCVGAHPHEIAGLGVGIKTQVPSVMNALSVRENIWIAARKRNSTREADRIVAETLERIGIADSAGEPVGNLAHGRRQLVEFGTVLAGDPWLILLDEPAAGLTAEEAERAVDIIVEMNERAAIIVVEHDMHFIRQLAKTVTVLHQGRILTEGHVDSVLSDPLVRDVYLGKSQ